MHVPPADSGAMAPDIYTAMQEQLGLKLSPFKGQSRGLGNRPHRAASVELVLSMPLRSTFA